MNSPIATTSSDCSGGAPWSVLIAGGDEAWRERLGRALREEGIEVRVTQDAEHAPRLAAGRDVVVLFPHAGTEVRSLELLRSLRDAPSTAGVSILVCCHSPGDSLLAARALDAGADAHLIEPAQPGLLVAAVRALARRGATARAQADQRALAELRVIEQRWRAVFNSERIGVVMHDSRGRVIECNETYARIFEAPSAAQLRGTALEDVVAPEDAQTIMEQFARRWEQGGFGVTVERSMRLRSGREIFIRASVSMLLDGEGNLIGQLGLVADQTDRKRLEQDLQRVQRTEAIGRLAGGVAHDVNNMLAVIIGYTEIVAGRLGAGHELQTELGEIRRAAERSRSLARDLLAFGRQQVLERRPLAPGEVVSGLRKLLRHTIRESIELAVEDRSDGAVVIGDRAQLETVIVNLVANARDAMADGGRLTLRTDVLAPTPAAPDGAVAISVTDTGSGMPNHVRERVFEPFFTTKELGQGSGMGLATVAGIVDQMGGEVSVDSRPGDGSTFRVTLPRVRVQHADPDRPDGARAAGANAVDAGRRVLVVEDQAQVRRLVERMLSGAGYSVLSAESAAQALELLRREPVDLMLTDMILPDLGGGQLAQRALELSPQLRVVYTSGYTGDAVAREGMPPGHGFLAKPYGPGDLERVLHDALEAPPGGGGGQSGSG